MTIVLSIAAITVSLASIALSLYVRGIRPQPPAAPGVSISLRPGSFLYDTHMRFPVGTVLTVRDQSGREVSSSLVNSSGLAAFDGLAPEGRYGIYEGSTLVSYLAC